MKILLIALFLVSPLTAQTRSELDSKYGPGEGNRYRVKPGIAMEVTFSDSGKAKQIRIFPDDPKDTEALMRPEDVRKIASEILPGRIGGGPESHTEIDVPCPPRNGCKGYQEVFMTLTALSAWHNRSIAYVVLTLNDENPPPPGNIKLLPGYEHEPHYGFDTRVGVIKKLGGLQIRYDIGSMAGNFAKRFSPNTAEWTRTEYVNNDSALIVLTKDNRIYATFDKAVANFFAKVSSQSDIDDFIKMVLTYDPRK
jgi:hypothetical protein